MSQLPNYHDDPHKYYQVLKRLTPDELTREWREITSRDYDYLLDCVPPRAINTSAFMVGECMTHTDHGPIYEVCVCITCGASRRYFARPAHLAQK